VDRIGHRHVRHGRVRGGDPGDDVRPLPALLITTATAIAIAITITITIAIIIRIKIISR
jgi:hypothetical protein